LAEESPGKLYPVEALREFTRQAFVRAGVPDEDARIVTDNLIESNLRGVDTHGITRLLPIYIRRLRAGVINPRPDIRIVSESPSAFLVDGDNGLGAVVATWANREVIERAGRQGAAWAGVRQSNHFGACAYFAMQAARQDMVGIAMTNGPAAMAPWGGRRPYFGTNPICFAAPSAESEPVVVDLATSLVARGHILLADMRGDTTIPEGWALDVNGQPTTDTKAAIAGTVMPMAAHKGYALAFMIDVLSGILTAAAFGPHLGSLYTEFERPQDVGHLLGAIDIGRLIPVAVFKQRLAQLCREVREAERADWADRIYVPGEIESEKRRAREAEGIPIAEGIRQEFIGVARELGISFD
jgi:LDH2 family malate/lactate/ureidoglycolate dehydrogenase